MKTYRSEDLASGDVTTAHYQGADILAVAQNVNGEDAVQSKSGSVSVNDDQFDFNPNSWGERDKRPFWIQCPFRIFPETFSDPWFRTFFPLAELFLWFGYPKEMMTRTTNDFGTITGMSDYTIVFDGTIPLEGEGCCNK